MAKNISFQAKYNNFNVDAFKKAAKEAFNAAVEKLAQGALEQAKAQARQKLHSTQQQYIDALTLDIRPTAGGIKATISLNPSAAWIEGGYPAFNLKDKMLKGRDSLVIPFNHSKKATVAQTNPTGQTLYNDAKSFLKTQGVTVSKPNQKFGQPIVGKVGSYNKVPSSITSKHGGDSVLNKLKVSQEQSPKGKVTVKLNTFRTMSKNQPNEMWNVPAYKGAKIFDDVQKWLNDNYQDILKDFI